MINDLLRKPTVSIQPRASKYETLGFTRNPFPIKPSVIIDSPNPVENGSIFLPELRENEQRKFEQLLIPGPDMSQVKPIVFLMDYATRRGRGIGKTSFLNYQRGRIMQDLGNGLSGGTQVIFASYILPLPEGRCRKFWQFCKVLTRSLVEQEIIATAMWRLRAFSGVLSENVLAEVGSEPQQTIGNNAWLQERNVSLWDLTPVIRKQLRSLGIKSELANALENFGHSTTDFQRNYLDGLTDHSWRQEGGQLFFDDLVKVLTVAGFTKGLLLVDEMEKIVPAQNTEERRTFVEALRYFFIDGQCQNARSSFYGLLLTIHPYLQELLNPHWEAAGLDRFAALGRELAQEYTVYFEPLNQESAVPLARAYLDASRISEPERGTLSPFDANALEEALMISGRVPGKFLTLLNNAIERAIREGWREIRVEQIRLVARAGAPKEPEEEDRMEALPPPQAILAVTGE